VFKSSQNNEIEPKRTNLKEGEEDASKKMKKFYIVDSTDNLPGQ